jgi:hypothetical protein
MKIRTATPVMVIIAKLSWIWQCCGVHFGEEKTCLFFLGRKCLLLLLDKLLAPALPSPVARLATMVAVAVPTIWSCSIASATVTPYHGHGSHRLTHDRRCIHLETLHQTPSSCSSHAIHPQSTIVSPPQQRTHHHHPLPPLTDL